VADATADPSGPETTPGSMMVTIDPGWLDAGVSAVLVSRYRLLRVLDEEVSTPRVTPVIPDVIGTVGKGVHRYTPRGRATLRSVGLELVPTFTGPGPETFTPDEPFILLVTPCEGGGYGGEAGARARTAAALGALAALFGRNMARELVFDTVFGLPPNPSVTIHSEMLRVDEQRPSLTPARMERLQHASRTWAEAGEGDRRSMELSLRWLHRATGEDGADALLSLWIAIEALELTTTDIAPISAALGKIYGLPASEAKAEFLVGRLFGLRGTIVHGGARPPIDALVIEYAEELYADLMLRRLGLPPEHRARAHLSRHRETVLRGLGLEP
jgi:hypothetical protein